MGLLLGEFMAKLPPGIWAASLLLFSGCALQRNVDHAILVDGKRHAEDAPSRAGGGWLALDVVGGQWTLVPAGVSMRSFHDEKVDSKGQKTITIKDKDRDVAFVKKGM